MLQGRSLQCLSQHAGRTATQQEWKIDLLQSDDVHDALAMLSLPWPLDQQAAQPALVASEVEGIP